MKKAFAILLVICLVFALAACGKKDGGADSGKTDDSAKSFPKEAGYFDPDYDYTQNKKFKVGYLVTQMGFLYDEFDTAYKDWAVRMNVNYTGMWAPTAGNTDEYLSGLQTFADQGYDGVILDADVTISSRIVEIMNSTDMEWVGGMAQYRDYTGTNVLYTPSVGFDNYGFGRDNVTKLSEWKEEAWPDVPWEKVGMIFVDFSLSPEIHQRSDGGEMLWADMHPEFGAYDPDVMKNPDNFWIVDVCTGNMDLVTAQNLVTQVVTANAQIEVWLVSAAVDDYSMGAANAAENLGLTDKLCTVCSGGSNLPIRWDNGQYSSWRYANFTAQTIFAEPIFCQLYSYMIGQATRDTIWPDWVNVNDKGDVFDADGKLVEEHNYATLKLPTFWIDEENYKSYLEWTDLYGYGPDAEGHYDYEKVTDLNLFPSRSTPPAEYKVKN